MITKIILPEQVLSKISALDLDDLKISVLEKFPYPLAKSFKNFLESAEKSDKEIAISNFARDIVTNLFQFLSLVLVSEYINGKIPRSLRVFQAVENMTYRPGPGKWMAFLRELYKHYRDPDVSYSSHFFEILDFIYRFEMGKKKPSILIEENYDTSKQKLKKLGFLEFLIKFRNNFAHSKNMTSELANELFDQLYDFVLYLYNELSFLMNYHIYVQSDPPIFINGEKLPDSIDFSKLKELKLQKDSFDMVLYPLLITEKAGKKRINDLFLMEELDNKRVFYSSSSTVIEKRKGKDEIIEKIFTFLNEIEVDPEELNESNINWDRFRNRCRSFSEHTLNEYSENKKYDESLYVYPQSYKDIIENFIESKKSVLFLSGDQGVGKSALSAHITNQTLKSENKNKAVIFIDSRNLGEYGKIPDLIEKYLKDELSIEGNFKAIIDKLFKKYSESSILIIFDNLNEYFSKEVTQSYLIERIIEFLFKYSADFGCRIRLIATSRPEMYETAFEKYKELFKDRCMQYTHMPDRRVTIRIPTINDDELGQIYSAYKSTWIGYSPKTGWSDLSGSVHEICQNPIMMQFLLRQYDGEDVPQDISSKQLKKQFSLSVLKDKSSLLTIHQILKKMKKMSQPYLLSLDLKDKGDKDLIERIFHSDIDYKTQKPKNSAYKDFVDQGIIREEIDRKEDAVGKKITLTNEIVFDVLEEEQILYEKKQKKIDKLFVFSVLYSVLILLFTYWFFIQYNVIELMRDLDTQSIFSLMSERIVDKYNLNGQLVLPFAKICGTTNKYVMYSNWIFAIIFFIITPPLVFGGSHLGDTRFTILLRSKHQKLGILEKFQAQIFWHDYNKKFRKIVFSIFFLMVAMFAVLSVIFYTNETTAYILILTTTIIYFILIGIHYYFFTMYKFVLKEKSIRLLSDQIGKNHLIYNVVLSIRLVIAFFLFTFCLWLVYLGIPHITRNVQNHYKKVVIEQVRIAKPLINQEEMEKIRNNQKIRENPITGILYSALIEDKIDITSGYTKLPLDIQGYSKPILLKLTKYLIVGGGLSLLGVFIVITIIFPMFVKRKVLKNWERETSLQI